MKKWEVDSKRTWIVFCFNRDSVEISGNSGLWHNRWMRQETESSLEIWFTRFCELFGGTYHIDLVKLAGGWQLVTLVKRLSRSFTLSCSLTPNAWLCSRKSWTSLVYTGKQWTIHCKTFDSEWMGPLFEFHGMTIDVFIFFFRQSDHPKLRRKKKKHIRQALSYGTK